jgi:hypothetical protein
MLDGGRPRPEEEQVSTRGCMSTVPGSAHLFGVDATA